MPTAVSIVHTCLLAGACHNLFLLWLPHGVLVFLANTFPLRMLLLSLDRRYWCLLFRTVERAVRSYTSGACVVQAIATFS